MQNEKYLFFQKHFYIAGDDPMRSAIHKLEPCSVPDTENLTSVGKPVERFDAIDKVTGEGRFTADITLPGMLYAKILRSPYAHADIVSIDTKEAEAADGVYSVVTGFALKHKRIGECINDQPVMAHTKVRFIGEPVAAVVADSPQAAARACELIRVTYNPLKPVFDPRESMEPDAPIIHEDLHDYECFKVYCPIKGSNIFHHFKVKKGNIEKGFSESDKIFEHEFDFPHISHCQLEPHACIATWKLDGTLEVYASAQSPFLVRNVLAKLFDISHIKTRVIVPYIGGGFGGKSDCTIEPLTAYIAKSTPGRPVKLVLDREEMFCGSLIGRGCNIRIRTGVKNDGTILARKIDLAFNSGAYGEYSINIIMGGGQNSTGPYYIPNVQIDAHAVYTNLPFVGAFRGYGHPEGHWAAERQIDIIAEDLGINPVEIRFKNALGPGKSNAIGQVMTESNGNLAECIRAVARSLALDNWKKVDKKQKDDGRYARGKGLAAFMKSPVMSTAAPSMCQLRFNEDLSVNIQISATEMGQGSLTALAQIAAETLKFPVEKIRISSVTDTEKHPYDWQTVASRTTWMAGNAVIRACMQAIGQIKNMAKDVWQLESVDSIDYDGEKVFTGDGRCIPVKSLAMGYVYPDGRALGGPVTGMGYFLPPDIVYNDPETGQGNAAAEWTFGCEGFDLTVDRLTAEVKINKAAAAIDVGKVINPTLAKGQMLGAIVQGLGAAANEEIIYSGEGKVRNSNFTDYKIPGAEDVADAEFDIIFLETPQHDGPYGARPIAEHGIVPVAPAFANAIRDALGIDFFKLPVNCDILMKKMREAEKI